MMNAVMQFNLGASNEQCCKLKLTLNAVRLHLLKHKFQNVPGGSMAPDPPRSRVFDKNFSLDQIGSGQAVSEPLHF